MFSVLFGSGTWLECEPRAGDVVGRIRELVLPSVDDPRKSRPTPQVHVVVIPAGAYAYQSVDLEPGTYLIDAVLPSGDIDSQTFAVGESRDPVQVWLRGGYSPHEWLSWQHLMGNVALKRTGFVTSAGTFSGERSP